MDDKLLSRTNDVDQNAQLIFSIEDQETDEDGFDKLSRRDSYPSQKLVPLNNQRGNAQRSRIIKTGANQMSQVHAPAHHAKS